MKIYTILLAGGSSSRMKSGINKVLLPVCGKSSIRRCMEAFSPCSDLLVIVSREQDLEAIRAEEKAASLSCPVLYATGGSTRQESVYNGLHLLAPENDDIVLIHDGARGFADSSLIHRVIRSVQENGSGIPAIPVTDTIKVSVDHATVQSTPDRNTLFSVQTPQGFWAKALLAASEKARTDSFVGTDDASVMEYCGYPVYLTEGSKKNMKLTTEEDLMNAKSLTEENKTSIRIGHGYDVHRLVPDRKLILCGVEIPYSAGLLGHSDADVATHALMDAMLGAAALGDIGSFFPDSDPEWKDISSLLLLDRVGQILFEQNFRIANADITIVAQQPRLRPYVERMREKIAAVLHCELNQISIKATTTEKLGFEGRSEGISAHAVCLIQSI